MEEEKNCVQNVNDFLSGLNANKPPCILFQVSIRKLDRNEPKAAKQRILDSRNELPLPFFTTIAF